MGPSTLSAPLLVILLLSTLLGLLSLNKAHSALLLGRCALVAVVPSRPYHFFLKGVAPESGLHRNAKIALGINPATSFQPSFLSQSLPPELYSLHPSSLLPWVAIFLFF